MKVGSLYVDGTLSLSLVLGVVTLKLAFETTHWTWVSHVIMWGSLGLYGLYLFVVDAIQFNPGLQGVIVFMAESSYYWLQFILLLGMSLLPDLVVMYLRRTFYPFDFQILNEADMVANSATPCMASLAQQGTLAGLKPPAGPERHIIRDKHSLSTVGSS